MRLVIDRPESPAFIQERVRRWRPTIQYLSRTEVHVYALAISASVLLSFMPFLIVILTLIREVFHFPPAERALFLALHDYFPSELGDFITRNLLYNLGKLHHGRLQITSVILLMFTRPRKIFSATVMCLQITSVILLMFTANGIFEPLEIELNRAWDVAENRSYFRNQLLSFLLIFLCDGLALGSVMLTAVNEAFVASLFGRGAFPAWLSLAIFKMAAVPITVVALFLIYWILPNRRVPVRRILPVAVLVGAGLEVLKYAFLRAWPWLDAKFRNEYYPFNHAVCILVFSMLTSLLVLRVRNGPREKFRKSSEFIERGRVQLRRKCGCCLANQAVNPL